jgi:hypothetical protein
LLVSDRLALLPVRHGARHQPGRAAGGGHHDHDSLLDVRMTSTREEAMMIMTADDRLLLGLYDEIELHELWLNSYAGAGRRLCRWSGRA